jgi:hypothetical protein
MLPPQHLNCCRCQLSVPNPLTSQPPTPSSFCRHHKTLTCPNLLPPCCTQAPNPSPRTSLPQQPPLTLQTLLPLPIPSDQLFSPHKPHSPSPSTEHLPDVSNASTHSTISYNPQDVTKSHMTSRNPSKPDPNPLTSSNLPQKTLGTDSES